MAASALWAVQAERKERCTMFGLTDATKLDPIWPKENGEYKKGPPFGAGGSAATICY